VPPLCSGFRVQSHICLVPPSQRPARHEHADSQADGRRSADGETSFAERAAAAANTNTNTNTNTTTSAAEPAGPTGFLAKNIAKELRRAKYAAQSTAAAAAGMSSPYARPLRVLCLHGFRSNAKKLKGRMMGFTRKLKVRRERER